MCFGPHHERTQKGEETGDGGGGELWSKEHGYVSMLLFNGNFLIHDLLYT
jgi:hypothetical protein